MYSCDSELETTAHFLFRCQNHVICRSKLIKDVHNLDQILQNYDDDHLFHTVLYSSQKFNSNLDEEIITLTVCHLKDTKRFDESLIGNIYCFFYYYFITSSWRWFMTYIHSNFGGTFFDFSGIEFFFESLYVPHICIYFVLFVCLFCYLCLYLLQIFRSYWERY